MNEMNDFDTNDNLLCHAVDELTGFNTNDKFQDISVIVSKTCWGSMK